jgi:hypothetical protein
MRRLGLFSFVVMVLGSVGWSGHASAQGFDLFYQGPKVCEECHQEEYKVWSKTQHSTGFRTIHRRKEVSAKDILAAEGGDTNMRKNETCLLCHFTPSQTSIDDTMKIAAGPSCETCHGASSIWMEIHDDYGGENVKKEDETPEHRKERILASSDAGMIWPNQLFDIAENCMFCHGMTNEEYDARTLKNMIEAGHPVRGEFELVLYSQGTVRHRFYDESDPKNNLEMTPAELARMFVTGHSVAFVKANNAKDRIPTKKYVEAQEQRIAAATRMLEAIKGKVPLAADLLANPRAGIARKLVASIKDMDLSAEVGPLLPDPKNYK